MRAHLASLIIVHVGVGQRCRAVDGESPALPAERTSVTFQVQGGAGRKVLEGSESKRTYVAWFWYTFESISVASPPEKT